MEHNDILILPDIHGRHFWKTAVSNPENYGKIIFLGDYLDPYPWEEITLHEAFENFRSIVAFKEEHPDQVILLLGNHDLHYVDKVYCDLAKSTRYDYDHAARNADFFHAHLPLFQLAFQTQNGDRSFLFTHAGVTQLWYYQHESEIGSLTADHLNSLLLNNIRILADVGYYRGGYADGGSMVWADIDEMLNSASPPRWPVSTAAVPSFFTTATSLPSSHRHRHSHCHSPLNSHVVALKQPEGRLNSSEAALNPL